MTTMTSSSMTSSSQQVVPRTYAPWSSWELSFRAFHLHGLLSRLMWFPLWLISWCHVALLLIGRYFPESSSLTLSAAMKSLLHVILISRMGKRAEGYVPKLSTPISFSGLYTNLGRSFLEYLGLAIHSLSPHLISPHHQTCRQSLFSHLDRLNRQYHFFVKWLRTPDPVKLL